MICVRALEKRKLSRFPLFQISQNMLPYLVNIPAAKKSNSYLDIYKVFVYIPLKRLANSSVTSTHHLCEFNEIHPTTNENELLFYWLIDILRPKKKSCRLCKKSPISSNFLFV